MDPYSARGFQQHNYNGYLSTEIFNYGHGANPNYSLMYQEEIPVEEPRHDYMRDDYMREYPSNNYQQMHQLYTNNDQYSNYGYQSPPRSHNYPYAPQGIPFDPNPGYELQPDQISVAIRLSRSTFINNHLMNSLLGEGFSCDVRGSVITVTGYPPRNGANGILGIVQEISGDRRAYLQP